LADTAHDVIKTSLTEESSEAGKVYGTVTNPNVWKRHRKGGAPKPAPAAPAPTIKTAPKVEEEPKPPVKEEPKPAQPASSKDTKGPANTSAVTAAKKIAAAPSFKRQGSSGGISQMFAKAAAKPKKPASSAASNTPSAAEDATPVLSDEGEDDSEMPDVKPDPEAGKARKNRQAELRRMMEESDDEEPEPEEEAPVDEPMEDEPGPPEPEPEAKEEPAEIISSTGDGRKRGRRRVTKKKQIMDDQGYLGKLVFVPHVRRLAPWTVANFMDQLPFKSKAGSRSLKTKPRRRLHQLRSQESQRQRQQQHRQPNPRRLLQRGREISCPSFPRNDFAASYHITATC
jgi:DNA polymerase delta subunit 3